MTNKKKISKLLKRKYKPSPKRRKAKTFNHFQYGWHFVDAFHYATITLKLFSEKMVKSAIETRRFFEMEYFNYPVPTHKSITEQLEILTDKKDKLRGWRFPTAIFDDRKTNIIGNGQLSSGEKIFTASVNERGFRYEIDFIKHKDKTFILSERRIPIGFLHEIYL